MFCFPFFIFHPLSATLALSRYRRLKAALLTRVRQVLLIFSLYYGEPLAPWARWPFLLFFFAFVYVSTFTPFFDVCLFYFPFDIVFQDKTAGCASDDLVGQTDQKQLIWSEPQGSRAEQYQNTGLLQQVDHIVCDRAKWLTDARCAKPW